VTAAPGPVAGAVAGPGGSTEGGAVGVRATGVTTSYDGGPPVLHGVDIEVDAGATLALLGPSGCGKTTLLRTVAGLEVPDPGTVVVGDRTVVGPGVLVPPERRRVGLVFQDGALFPHLSVARNVGFGLPRGDRRSSERIEDALRIVGLDGLGERMPSTLSGGQRQRVALARAIAPRPGVLLLDEPFSNLDAALRVQVRAEVHALLLGLGMTAVFVTHDQDEAFVLGDTVAVMRDGRVVQVGIPQELYLRPADRWVASFVGHANLLPGRADGAVAATALGPVELDRPARGPVEVLARPEQLELVTDGSGRAGATGTVELVEYVGHDTTYVVRVDGAEYRVRVASAPACGRGDRVGLRHRGGPAHAFPSEPAPAASVLAPSDGPSDRHG
jgi:iron(III) transport system ATP-binding protein